MRYWKEPTDNIILGSKFQGPSFKINYNFLGDINADVNFDSEGQKDNKLEDKEESEASLQENESNLEGIIFHEEIEFLN